MAGGVTDVTAPVAAASLAFRAIGHDFPAPGTGAPMTVLQDVSFDVDRGQFVSVIGPSGCGKSTLVQMAAGLLMPTQGQVSQHGTRIMRTNREVGLVPQQALLFPWKTLFENVEFPLVMRGVDAEERRARATAAIASVDLAGFEQHYPYQLSGGMQKRASIARMLVYRPEVVLMDEPFGALDAQTRMVMQSDLQALLTDAGMTVLFITHDITEAVLLSDKVVVLSRRPTRILAQVPIDLPRPRDMFEPFATPGFADAYDRVWTVFRGEIGGGRASHG